MNNLKFFRSSIFLISVLQVNISPCIGGFPGYTDIYSEIFPRTPNAAETEENFRAFRGGYLQMHREIFPRASNAADTEETLKAFRGGSWVSSERSWHLAREYRENENYKGLRLICRVAYFTLTGKKSAEVTAAVFDEHSSCLAIKNDIMVIDVLRCGFQNRSTGEYERFYFTMDTKAYLYVVKQMASVSAAYELHPGYKRFDLF